MVTHCRSAVEALRPRPIAGFAIATTDASSWTMNRPRATASKVSQGLDRRGLDTAACEVGVVGSVE